METMSSNSKQLLMLQEQKRKRSQLAKRLLDDYLEESTHVTLPLSEEDFIGLDEAVQEYGEDFSGMMWNNLKKTQQRNREVAEAEEELYLQRRQRHDPLRTLRQKPSNLTAKNLQYNDKLMDKTTQVKEFVRDDGEDFAAGFDDDFDVQLADLNRVGLRPQLHVNKHRLLPHDVKVLSLMGYNFNEGVKKRISRFPSLSRLNSAPPPQNLARQKSKLSMVTSELHPPRLSKEERLAQYRSVDEQAPVRSRHKPNIKNFREVPQEVMAGISSMRLNKERQVWEGNEIDLARFEQPHLIPKHSADTQIAATESHMVFDSVNMRWNNTKHDEEDVFSDIPDLTDDRHNLWRPASSYKLAAPPKSVGFTMLTANDVLPLKPKRKDGGTIRRSASRATFSGLEFDVSEDLLRRFEKEETKIAKKVNNWFPVGEVYDYRMVNDEATTFQRDYYWEIRKLVLDS